MSAEPLRLFAAAAYLTILFVVVAMVVYEVVRSQLSLSRKRDELAAAERRLAILRSEFLAANDRLVYADPMETPNPMEGEPPQ